VEPDAKVRVRASRQSDAWFGEEKSQIALQEVEVQRWYGMAESNAKNYSV